MTIKFPELASLQIEIEKWLLLDLCQPFYSTGQLKENLQHFYWAKVMEEALNYTPAKNADSGNKIHDNNQIQA